MTLEPFRSAMSVGQVGDTSLAVPSDIHIRSAQQRVMDQVHTISRSKSRSRVKSGSGITSPISPKSDSVFYDVPSIQTSPNTLKGFTFTNRSAIEIGSMNKESGFVNGSMNKGSGFVNGSINRGSGFVNGSINRGSGFVNGSINRGSAHVNGHAKMQVVAQDSAFSSRTVNMSRSLSHNSSGRQRNGTGQRVPPVSPTAWHQNKVQMEGYSRASRATRASRASSRSVPDLQQRMVVSGQTQQTRRQFLSSTSSPQMILDGPLPLSAQRGTLSQPIMNQSFVRRPPSNYSNPDSKISASKGKITPVGQTAEGQKVEISMTEAIHYLFSMDENYQLSGASFIQHSTYTEDKTKQQVFQLKGIPPLIALLRSPNPEIQQTASAALRNLVYKNHDNKEEVQRCGGVTEVVQLLKDSQSAETQKHLTGLLWNLSSADSLKADLLKSSLPALTEHVVLPFTDVGNLNNNMDPEIFFNATGCLRNLSSAKLGNRQAMRKTSGLVDALVKYVQTCVSNDNPDDKSVENCLCVLHNLTYQLEAESPQLFTRITALARAPSATRTSTAGPISCFSTQSNKIQQETYFDYPVMEDNNPKGSAWLFHSKTLQMYLSLLETSDNQSTLEACFGAMQNLTANSGTVSSVLSQTIVQKLNGLRVISQRLKSEDVSLKRCAVSLLGNLSRHPRLHTSMARQALSPLTAFISAGVPNTTEDESEMDETMAAACHTAHTLLKAEQEMSKALLSNSLINSLNNMSHNNNLPMSSKAAALLLYNLWAQKDFQSVLKKKGMHKRAFVNDITTAAHKAVMVID